MEKTEANYLEALDIGYSYNLAKKLEEFRSNPALGYRTAGSAAERQAGPIPGQGNGAHRLFGRVL